MKERLGAPVELRCAYLALQEVEFLHELVGAALDELRGRVRAPDVHIRQEVSVRGCALLFVWLVSEKRAKE